MQFFMPKVLLDPFPEANLRFVNIGTFACFPDVSAIIHFSL